MKTNDTQKQELAEAIAQSHTTKRATVPALEEILYKPFEILDHGFVRLVDVMGDDHSIVQAARVSYGTGTKTVRADRGLNLTVAMPLLCQAIASEAAYFRKKEEVVEALRLALPPSPGLDDIHLTLNGLDRPGRGLTGG